MAIPVATIAKVAGSVLGKAKDANEKSKDEAEGSNKKEEVEAKTIDKKEDKMEENEDSSGEAKPKDDVSEFTSMLESELPKYVKDRRY